MVILNYGKDDKKTIRNKLFMFDCMNMLQLKSKDLWWSKDEQEFIKKYNISSNRIKGK